MATPTNSDAELLTEHFGFHPVSLLDDIINTVNVLAKRALDSVERLLLSIPPQKLGFSAKKSSKTKTKTKSKSLNPEAEIEAESNLPPEEAAKLEIENGTHQLETLLNASIDNTFDVFELYVMQNILNVKAQDQPFIRQKHHAGLDFSDAAQQQEDRPTSGSITELRRRLQASQKLNAMLEAEKARNEVLLQKLRSLVGAQQRQQQQQPLNDAGDQNGEVVKSKGPDRGEGAPFAFLREKGGLEDSGGDQPITTTAEFSLSQLQAVQSLSASLRGLLPHLGKAEAGEFNADSAKSWRRERTEYIETSSRKCLETVGGLELSPEGNVRDGDWQGPGRGFRQGEVEELEKAVALLEKAKGDATPPYSTNSLCGGDDKDNGGNKDKGKGKRKRDAFDVDAFGADAPATGKEPRVADAVSSSSPSRSRC